MSGPQAPGTSRREATPDAVIAAALRHAADVTDNARAVFQSHPRLPVVFMSGYTANALRFELGPRDSLAPKPLAPSEVARVVREALDRAADD